MRSYSTIMYALDLSKREFWLGEVDGSGTITGFTNFILSHNLPHHLNDENLFYYVKVEDNNGDLDVHVAQWYAAIPKSDAYPHRSIVAMSADGTIDPIEAANKLLWLHRRSN